MSNLKSCLNIVFKCALDDDIISKNPAKNLQVPQTESFPKEQDLYTKDFDKQHSKSGTLETENEKCTFFYQPALYG